MEQETIQKPAQVKEKTKSENPMRSIFIEKVLLSAGGIDTNLEKAAKLLELLSGRKAQIISSTKRIPDFGVRPGLKVGARVTLRGKQAVEVIKRLLGAVNNELREKQVSENHFSFGIPEYIEIPEMEYQRDIGIRGLNVTVVLARKGLRIKRKKVKSSNVPQRQHVSKDEVIKFMEDNFSTEFE